MESISEFLRLRASRMDGDELNELIDLTSNIVRDRRKMLDHDLRETFVVGQVVRWIEKDGHSSHGTIIKIDRSRAKIHTGQGLYSVPFSLLHEYGNGKWTLGSPRGGSADA